MKRILYSTAALMWVGSLHAQSPTQDLSFTLPSGKVITFQSYAQKEQFIASRERLRQGATTSDLPSPQPQRSATALGHTALDERPSGTGVANVAAPAFTSDYYLPSAETWVGKPVTLSVAYIEVRNETPRADGMRQLEAKTYGRMPGTGQMDSGGWMTILATPEAARRIITLCGSTLQFTAGVKTTLIHGQMAVLTGTGTSNKEYGLVIDQ